jgi:perosamine synthetase
MNWNEKRKENFSHRTSYKRKLFNVLPFCLKSPFSNYFGLYPRLVGREVKAVKEVLSGTSWNMSYSTNGKHAELESFFADYVGSEYAVAVGSGGVGIQMLVRALGLDGNSEVLIQADTCSAVPQALLNAQTIPVMADVDTETFQFSRASLMSGVTNKSKMILATHMWGNPENLKMIEEIALKENLLVVEDACLALGGKKDGKTLGSISLAGIFSFGSTKPVQAGEGGMLVTNNGELAKELKSLRNWGDRETEYGERDVKTLSWNGRMPEVTAAIALEQLRGYPSRLTQIQSRVSNFRSQITKISDISIVPSLNDSELAFTQLSLRITKDSRFTKNQLIRQLKEHGIPCFHANFEPLTELSLFKSGEWLKWIKDGEKRTNPVNSDFPGAYEVFNTTGIGLLRSNFSSTHNYNKLLRAIKEIFQA